MPLPSLPPVPVIGKTIPTTWGGLARAFMEALGKGENWIVGDQPTQPDAAGAPNSF
ncbi:MAG TPA: hypothetical protein VLV83_13110 [Acidobacteriota bacterium]|nr:hypothetical protein [Acidobacteriota bacterium]